MKETKTAFPKPTEREAQGKSEKKMLDGRRNLRRVFEEKRIPLNP
jgi:hypothetical protein